MKEIFCDVCNSKVSSTSCKDPRDYVDRLGGWHKLVITYVNSKNLPFSTDLCEDCAELIEYIVKNIDKKLLIKLVSALDSLGKDRTKPANNKSSTTEDLTGKLLVLTNIGEFTFHEVHGISANLQPLIDKLARAIGKSNDFFLVVDKDVSLRLLSRTDFITTERYTTPEIKTMLKPHDGKNLLHDYYELGKVSIVGEEYRVIVLRTMKLRGRFNTLLIRDKTCFPAKLTS